MNMISTGAFQTEMTASKKQSELVSKLVKAWEKKNSKVGKAGGVSLMALSLAACGGEDTTPFSQSDVDAAKATATTAATTAALTGSDGTVHATVDAAVTSNDTSISSAATTAALTATDGTIYADVNAAYTAGSNVSNADAVTTALTGSDGTVHATVDAAVTSNDATVTTAATAAAETTLMAGSGFTTVADLLAAYTTATAGPGVGQTFTLTTAGDQTGTLTGSSSSTSTAGNDTFNATSATYTAGDIIDGGAGTDVLNIVAAAEASISAAGAVVDVETVAITINSFNTETIDMANVVGASITVSNSQVGGAASVTVNNLSSTSNVTTSADFTGTLSVTGSGTVNAVDAGTVTASLTADGTSITIIGDDSTNAINLDAASANAATTTDSATISGAGTITLDPENGNNENVENLTLSGNGAAVSYDITDGSIAGNTLETVTLTGDQNITITASSTALAGLDAAADYADNSTGTVTVVVDTQVAADLTHVKADVMQFGVALGAARTMTIANNQTLEITADVDSGNNGALTLDSTELTTGNEHLNLEIQATQTNAGINVSDFETVTVNIDDQATTAGTITVAALTGGAGTDITITGSQDNVTLTSVTADNLIATNYSGVLTVSATGTAVDNITGGSGADSVTHNGDAAFTFSGGAGNDTFETTHALTNRTITVDGGAGVDTVVLNAVYAATDRFSLTNVEVVDMDNRESTFDVRDFTGQTLALISTGDTNGVTTFDASNVTSVDLSNVTVDDAEVNITVASVGNLPNTIIGTNAGDTITGGNAADTITGGAGADTLTGGTGVDTITGGEGADTIDGEAGADVINLTEVSAAADDVLIVDSTDGSDTITGFSSATGGVDQILFSSDDATSTSDVFDGGKVVLANTDPTNTAGTKVDLAAADYVEITSTGTMVDNKVNVLTDTAGFASVTAAMNAVDDNGTQAANDASILLVFHNSTDGEVQLHYVSEIGTSANNYTDETTVELAAFSDIAVDGIAAAFSVANFGVYSEG